MAQLNTRIVLRNDSTATWLANSTQVLLKGEVGIEFLADGKVKMKIGDGVKTWAQLDYFGGEESHVFEVELGAEETHDAAIARIVGDVEPVKGDITVVKKLIDTGKYSYTAYVYNGTAWAAMDGNVSASNVYFEDDLMTTTAMGNISLTNGQATISAKGQNLVDVFNTIYVKETNTGLKTGSPTAALSSTSPVYYEIGTTGTRNITVSMSDDGSYKYGYLPLASETGNEVAGDPATTITTGASTGVVVNATTPYELTFNGNAVSPTATNGGTFTLEPAAQTTRTEMKMKGKVNYGKGGIPVSNLKKLYPAQRIGASSVETSEASAFRWYIPFYTGFIYGDDAIADHANITAAQITSKLTKSVDATAYDKTKVTSATATKAWRQYYIAYPKDWSYDMSEAKDGNNIDCTVNQAADVTININGTNVVYSVYYINNAADYGTLSISWKLA